MVSEALMCNSTLTQLGIHSDEMYDEAKIN